MQVKAKGKEAYFDAFLEIWLPNTSLEMLKSAIFNKMRQFAVAHEV